MAASDTDVRYPDVVVPLVGEDGNAWSILGRVTRALERADVERDEINEFLDEAMSGDYDHLLYTVTRWVSVGEADDYEDF